MVKPGSTVFWWLAKCLATVVWDWFFCHKITLKSINDLILVCATYFILHQLHSWQKMRLLLWHVPFIITLYVLLCKFLIVTEWEIPQYLQVCSLLQPQNLGLEGCGIFVLPAYPLKRQVLCNRSWSVLLQIPGGTKPSQARPMFG